MLDITLASLAVMLFWPVLLWFSLRIWWQDDGPIFYVSERMKTPEHSFGLLKFRTMRVKPDDTGVTGPQKADRITPLGAMMRRHRFDELPQLWNILKGDISIVGPRPPLREYVERFPQIYADVLKSRPGVTGLATLAFHQREARLLADCTSAAETEEVYCRRCIPTKARLDLTYQRSATLLLDIWILWRTLRQLLMRTEHPNFHA
jgi:lipopolysaccharide/colanic/teichoic acid biosynthesis glycosyltransferase